MDVGAAKLLAEDLLANDLPDRWAHTQGVAQQAETLNTRLRGDGPLVVAAAWLHDIGYAPSIAATGFHPLDGARHLRDVVHADTVICSLVAHHSGAEVEADERALSAELNREFPLSAQSSRLLDALTACDMTVSPTGQRVHVEYRISEIQGRYEVGDPVHRAVARSTSFLIGAAHQYFS